MRSVITHFYNEEYLLPYWINHHKKIFNKGILIDYHSTDNSNKICKRLLPLGWKVVKTENKDFSAELCDLEVSWYEKNISGWKIALNVTEFFVCPKISYLEDECIKKKLIGFKSTGVIMVDKNPKIILKENIPIIVQKKHGFKQSEINTSNFKKEIRFVLRQNRTRLYHRHSIGVYLPGRHESHLSCIGFSEKSSILWYGFSPWNKSIINRKLQIKKKIPINDILRGLGKQHLYNFNQLKKIRDSLVHYSHDLSTFIDSLNVLSKDNIKYNPINNNIKNKNIFNKIINIFK